MAEQAIGQSDRDRPDRKSGDEAAATKRGGVDRDALHPADYGSRRRTGVAGTETSEETQQGGALADEASSEGP